MAAAGLAEVPVPDPEWLLRHANAIEGHPDNVAAAIYGGFVLAYEGRDGSRRGRARRTLDRRALFIPARWRPQAARGLLPETVPHVDAAANSGRAALLVHAMAGDPTWLCDATRDWLHQDYREPAMPRSLRAGETLRGTGFAAVISGAGPTVLVLGDPARSGRTLEIDSRGFSLRLSEIGARSVDRGRVDIDPSRRIGCADQTVTETPGSGASLIEPTRSEQLRRPAPKPAESQRRHLTE